jgi:hypothetical protein
MQIAMFAIRVGTLLVTAQRVVKGFILTEAPADCVGRSIIMLQIVRRYRPKKNKLATVSVSSLGAILVTHSQRKIL